MFASTLCVLSAVITVAAAQADGGIPALIESRDNLQGVPFARVVEEATGRKIIPVSPGQHADILKNLATALDATLRELNSPGHAIHQTGRINEASRHIEDELLRRLNEIPGWKCTFPLTREGLEQRSGYPDLRLATDTGLVIYLDPKLHADASRDSSLRTFYYEPKTLTGKIQEDAMHLLVGIAHDGGDSKSLHLRGWELVDLSKVEVKLKAEFQASNRDLYAPNTVVLRSSEQEKD